MVMDGIVPGVTGITGLLLMAAASLACFVFIQRRRLPPGPWGLPLLGCLPFWKGPETNMEWYKEYGDIYSVKMGPNLVVYLNSVSLVDAFLRHSDVFVNRPPGPAAIGEGILFGSGEKWRLNKKLCLKTLGSDAAEVTFDRHFQDESSEMMAELEKCSGQEINLTDKLRPCIVNGLCRLIRGTRYSYGDPHFTSLVTLLRGVDDVDLLSLSTAISLKFPRLWALIPHRSPDLREMTTELTRVIRSWIAERQNPGNKSTDLLDSFLNSEEYKNLNSTDEEMVQSSLDMYNGGLAATLSGLEFLFLFLIHNPDVQRKIQSEIDDVIRSNRKPCWADNSKLPFTVSTIMETLRVACITPSTLPHVASRDTSINGYHIPQGTSVVASVYCLHKLSENPECFKPERFLGKDTATQSLTNFIPFGIEPRRCPGDKWFHVFCFLIVTSVLQRFNVSQPQGKELPPFKTKIRIVRRLEPYALVLTPRKTT